MAIGKELGLGVNSFNKVDMKSNVATAADLILKLLVMRPGDIPSLPHLGIDISKYVYKLGNTLNTNDLKDIIYNQCNDMLELIISDEMNVFVSTVEDGSSVLVIYIPMVVDGEVVDSALYAFQQDKDQISYKYSLESQINLNK